MSAHEDDTLATVHDPGGSLPVAPEPTQPQVGRYLLLDRLGAGAMGTVFLALDPELDRKVAIKLLRGGSSKVTQTRMLREAQAMARLSHPNVVAVYDVGWFGAEVFMAMEYVAGGNLKDWLEDGERGWEKVLAVFIAAGRGLVAAHAEGLVHRDFKPANVLMSFEGQPKVTDFGLVRYASSQTSEAMVFGDEAFDGPEREPEPGPPASTPAAEDEDSRRSDPASRDSQRSGESRRSVSSSSALNLQLTRVGSSVGTPAYMAPEQFGKNESIDARCDQFAFCVALHEALWGVAPYEGGDLKQRLRNILDRQRRPRPRDRGVPPWLEAIVDRGLEPERDDRWPSMEALLAALSDDPRRRRRVRRRWAVGLSLGLVFGAGVWGQQRAAAASCEAEAGAARKLWANHAASLREAVAVGRAAYAEANVNRVEAGLEDWVARWEDARRATCAGTRPSESGVLAQTERCLAQQLDALASLLAVLEDSAGAPSVAAHAITAVAALPDPAACRDPRYAEADLSVGDCAPELNLRLHRLRALERSGLYDEGLAAGEELLAAPGLKACAALEAQVLLTTARVELGQGLRPPEESAARLRQALRQANLREDLHTARAAALELAKIARRQREFEAAAVWLELAELYGARLGSPPTMVIEQALLQAQLASDTGRAEPARVELERARSLLVETLGEQHPAYFEYLLVAASVEDPTTELGLRRPLLEQAFEIAAHLYGPDHPETVEVMLRLVPLQDDPKAQLALARSAQRKAEAAHGPLHLQSLRAAEWVGVALAQGGDNEAARAHYEQLLPRYEQLPTPAPYSQAIALGHYGVVLRRLREHDEAEDALRQTLELLERELGRDHPDVSTALLNLANVVDELGRMSEAVSLQRRALAIFESHESNTLSIALVLNNMGMLELELGDAPTALRNIQRAATIGRALLPAEDLRNIDYLTDLAIAEAANGRVEQAHARFTELMQLCADHPEPHNMECVYTRGMFARQLLELGIPSAAPDDPEALTRALQLCEEALAHLDALSSPWDEARLRFIHATALARGGREAEALSRSRAIVEELGAYPDQRRAQALIAQIRGWQRGLP